MGERLALAMLAALALAATTTGCYSIRSSSGGGEIPASAARPRAARASDVVAPDGYRVEVVAEGLTFPTSALVDEAGDVFVIEGGYSYGESFARPAIVRVSPSGERETVWVGENPPLTGAVYRDGTFFVAEGGVVKGGRILAVKKNGEARVLVSDLPSLGDHHTNGPALGPDGFLYFSVGTATNSGIVGADNADFGWLHRRPRFHDVPCKDVVLAGVSERTKNPLTPAEDDEATTGAFSPFGTAPGRGERIAGKIPCSGAVFKMRPEGGPIELVAWGFRNPYGLAFSPEGRLFVTENGFDIRGSRPVYGTEDVLWAVEPGRWYGWPDHSAGRPLSDERFRPPGGEAIKLLLAEPPGDVPKPVAHFGVHSSSNGLDFSRSEAFGHVGEAFVAQFGDMTPSTGKVFGPVGFKVVRVDVKGGIVRDFLANRGSENGPASFLGHGGLERPVSARFDPEGRALYVVDFGVMRMTEKGPAPVKRSGILWRVSREGGAR